jgi:hypothetical protein
MYVTQVFQSRGCFAAVGLPSGVVRPIQSCGYNSQIVVLDRKTLQRFRSAT